LETTTFEVTGVVLALVAITAGTGLVVAVVLRARDNILKVIGTAASLVTIAASQFFLLPELRASTFTTWKVCGGGLVTTATWCYNHYSQEPWPLLDPAYEAIPRENAETESSLPMPRISLSISDEEAEKGNAGSEARDVLDHTLRQDATKVVLCLIFTAFVTYEVTLRQTG
jgi:UDP-sugar transporter A1/2/3